MPPPPTPAAEMVQDSGDARTAPPSLGLSVPKKVITGLAAALLIALSLWFASPLFINSYVDSHIEGKGKLEEHAVKKPPPEKPKEADTPLVLQNIVSERRYADGAMQLVVQGEVANKSKEVLPLPEINVDAVGPDERIIQSWRIKPPAATLSPDSALPFSSSILSPEGTVVEVNLSFVEMAHDKP